MKVQLYKISNRLNGCLICGKPLVYSETVSGRVCHICGSSYETQVSCEVGHFICDKCHSSAVPDILLFLRNSDEKNVTMLFRKVTELRGVNLHGPEHHTIVPAVLLTSYRNNGGEIDYNTAINTLVSRAGKLPGGICGYWGACGAAVGAGIYASVLLGSNPLNAAVWSIPQLLTSRCLEKIAEVGGPRCCKRTARISIELAGAFTREQAGIVIPVDNKSCGYSGRNRECTGDRCPYYGG